ncbi:MAG: ApbE family protein [Candidatus Marinimicrobia bacterium]|nr:ApbE family protein [Candidatus Neomarinimicrobiota bacterium]|tara:strand:- start:1042 stop:1227 length:186 start_codon:yes stop_codon:yes gene_type:complete
MEYVLSLIILFLAITAMSIGVIFNRKPLSGSCGGLNSNSNCSICGGDANKCENEEIKFPAI